MFNIGKVTVYLGESVDEFNRVRNCLDVHDIKYRYHIISHEDQVLDSRRGSIRTEWGTSGISDRQGKLYEILVSAKDAEAAQAVLNK